MDAAQPAPVVLRVRVRQSSRNTCGTSSAVLHGLGETAPHLIYVPEADFSIEKFLKDVRKEMAKHKAVIVAVSEGLEVPEGVQSGVVDNFGHKYLAGIGSYLEETVRKEIGCKVRSIQLNVMQRCSSHLCSRTDIDESEAIGAAGVRCALNGETGKVMVFRRLNDMPYTVTIETAEASKIANREKALPKSYINTAGNNITAAARKYFMPLIQGELTIQMNHGVPAHFTIQESLLK